jgi:hypothetical protein
VVRGANCPQCTHCHLLVPKPAAVGTANAATAATTAAVATPAEVVTASESDASVQEQPEAVRAEVA